MKETERDFIAELEDVSVDIKKAREMIGLFVSENEGKEPGLYNLQRTFVLTEVALDLLWNIEKKMPALIREAFSLKKEEENCNN